MGNKKDKKTIWVRLKRVFRKMIDLPQRGDGGAHSDKAIEVVTKHKQDTTLIQKDSIVAKPRN